MRHELDWTGRLRALADAPPLAPRLSLWAPGCVSPFGSIEAVLAVRMQGAGLPLYETSSGWQVGEPFEAALERIARWLSANLLDGRWRDERLDVSDESGQVLGAIERAVVRPLGIATRAVHLVGVTVDRRVWVQQRAADKAVDPGRWDTLMGGLIGSGESVAMALERETWEEAGLRLAQLERVEAFGELTVRRPVSDGYMVEYVHCWEARLHDGVLPVNRDGEVQRFEALDRSGLEARLQSDAFTIEAALVLARWLEVRR